MKKMQCEACGSIELKKIAEDIFECQHCGVQYSAAEAKNLLVEIAGKVKIDHSEEVGHNLKRAEQCLAQGDLTKALEYLNKALDLDPENDDILHKIEAVTQKQKKSQDMRILQRTLSSEEAFESFLKNFKTLKNVAPDIYQEIEIISKKRSILSVCGYVWIVFRYVFRNSLLQKASACICGENKKRLY